MYDCRTSQVGMPNSCNKTTPVLNIPQRCNVPPRTNKSVDEPTAMQEQSQVTYQIAYGM